MNGECEYYEVGAPYVDASGKVFFRRALIYAKWPWRDAYGMNVRENVPERPLRKLVPEDTQRRVQIGNACVQVNIYD
jgi:hypothetical protein